MPVPDPNATPDVDSRETVPAATQGAAARLPIERRPAAMLEGVELDGGWTVGRRLPPERWTTGGLYSFGYEVSHPEHGEAFLKALDYSEAFAAPDTPAALKLQTEAYVQERELLERCRNAGLDRIVSPLASGQVNLPGQLIPVNYLIFERAEGDVRGQFAALESFDLAWVMRVLHSTAAGIGQLHGEGIAHQDLKPSNLLSFSGRKVTKIADLGRAEQVGAPGPYHEKAIAGDWAYAPPEHLYGERDPDWGRGRRACDLYHLGSMISFFFLGLGTTPGILSRLDPAQYPGQWGDGYAAVLPYVRDATDEVAEALEAALPAEHRERLGAAFRELSDPEPDKRGHPLSRAALHSDRFSVERYVALFDLIAKRAERRLEGAEE